ncbi:MAG: GAF domain-containing protein, partial [Anaerolineales bacterium]|nr:GAF domain-containing protein [Anaerolineales bacterium]
MIYSLNFVTRNLSRSRTFARITFLTFSAFCGLGVAGCDASNALTPTSEGPFWQTWWFIGLLIFALIVTIIGLSRMRVASVEARSRELADEVEERTHALELRTLELERQQGELTALYRADEQLHRYLELDEVLQSLVDTAVEILQADKGALLIWDDKRESMHVEASHGIHEDTIQRVSIGPGEGIAGIVAQTGELIAVEDVEADERVTREIVDAEGIRSFMQVPIKIGGEVFGVFSADYTKPHWFDEQEKRLLTSLAQRAALAIENARLYEDTKNRLAQVNALQETIRAIVSTLDLDHLLNIIIQQAATLLKADGGMINLVDWERMEDDVVAATGIVDFTLGISGPLEGSLSGWATLRDQPLISNDVQQDIRVHPIGVGFVGKVNLSSAAVAPMKIKDQVMGTIVVVGTVEGKG